jgi:hypothetical protein
LHGTLTPAGGRVEQHRLEAVPGKGGCGIGEQVEGIDAERCRGVRLANQLHPAQQRPVSTGTELNGRGAHRHTAFAIALADADRIGIGDNVGSHKSMLATEAEANLHLASLPPPRRTLML